MKLIFDREPADPVPQAEVICTACGALGDTRIHTRGSIWIEIVLWIAFLVPGLIYTIWRLTTQGRVCGQCGSTQLITVGSPKGKKLLAELHPDARIVSGSEGNPGGRLDGGTVHYGIYAVIAVIVLWVILVVWVPAFR